MNNSNGDIVILGAGAAGLMAAIRAAECGRSVLLLEKNRKPGVKILMSGGTRCNITHATNNRGIVEAYGNPGKFLHSALAAFSVEDTLNFFHQEGVATKVEETGKIFPVSNKATDVLAALVRRLERSGANVSLAEPVSHLTRQDAGFCITTSKQTIFAPRVILTTGGKSYPGSGTIGEGYKWAASFGHTIVPPRPALVPITVSEPWVKELRGITVPDVGASIFAGTKKLIDRRGSMLFAHFGLSGPVILDISRVVTGHEQPRSLKLQLDFLPDIPDQELAEFLQTEALQAGKKLLAGILADKLPRRLAETILTLTEQNPERKAAGLSKEQRNRLVLAMKKLEVPISGTLGFEKAEVTAGGVSLKEVDSRDMQSKLVPNLYFAGEILDLDGPIGGYNFQAAWSTGWLAGESAANACE